MIFKLSAIWIIYTIFIINNEKLNIDDDKNSDIFLRMVQITSMLRGTNKVMYINVRDNFLCIIFSGNLKTQIPNNYIFSCLRIQDDTLFTFKIAIDAYFISWKILMYSSLANQGFYIPEIGA